MRPPREDGRREACFHAPPYTLEQVERIVRDSEGRPTSFPPSRGEIGHPLERHERLSNEDLRLRYVRELARRDAIAERRPDDGRAQRRAAEAMFFTAFVRTIDVFQLTMAAINGPAGHDAYALMFNASNSHDSMRAEITHSLIDARGGALDFPIRYALGTQGVNPARSHAVRLVLDRVPERWERLHVHTVFPLLQYEPDGCAVRNRRDQVVQFNAAELANRRLVLAPTI